MTTAPMQPGMLDRRLSKQFQRPPYSATEDRRPKYASSKQQTTCDECFAVQHETRGKYGPRSRVSTTRTMPDGTRLWLCSQHADLWREVDEKTKPKKAPKANRSR